MVVLRATRQKRDLLVDGRKNASEQDKLWRQNGLCSQGCSYQRSASQGDSGLQYRILGREIHRMKKKVAEMAKITQHGFGKVCIIKCA
jgi:hypothetical protein